jgi:DNA-directed RNA polymerase I, II, and III subunit RPABC1
MTTEKNHILVPKHIVMKKEEVSQLLSTYNVRKNQLPKISQKDPALKNIEFQEEDVIMIERKSKTSNVSKFYRVVI